MSSSGRIYAAGIEIDGRRIPAYAIEGSPDRIVQHAILELASRMPDVVVSGINYGETLGSSIAVSGTVGAAATTRSAALHHASVSSYCRLY
jgi:5'-nucleotidase